MTDGLSQLAQRGRRTREIPPPRNPARRQPVQLAPVPDAPPATETAATAEPSAPEPAVRPEPTRAGRAALKVVSVYLEQGYDDFLEANTHTGRTSSPKVAVSRGAVVRLAWSG
jgi:hypothetical protein